MDTPLLVVGLLCGFVIGILIMRIISLHERRDIRKSAVKGSKNSIIGEVYEKILPALPSFPYNPKDMVFIGKGCDYIIFDGLTA